MSKVIFPFSWLYPIIYSYNIPLFNNPEKLKGEFQISLNYSDKQLLYSSLNKGNGDILISGTWWQKTFLHV